MNEPKCSVQRGLHRGQCLVGRVAIRAAGLGHVGPAATALAAEGIEAEVIDLRTIRPIDRETVIESVKKTTRLLCVYEAVKTLGIGAEISARIAESEAFDYLDAPILRLGGAESPIPYNPELEKAAVPQVPGIIEGLRNLVRGRM